MQRQVRDVVRSVAVSIDRELAATMTTLKALASSPSLQEGALQEFYGQAAAAHEVSGDHFFLTSRDGKQLYVTNGLSDDMSIVDIAQRKTLRSIAAGRVPHSVVIDTAAE